MTRTNWRRTATFIIGSIFTGILALIAACTPLITGVVHEILNAPPPPVLTSTVPNIEPVAVPAQADDSTQDQGY